MRLWVMKCYLSQQGRDLIRDWYEQQSEGAKAAFEVKLQYLLERERDEWIRPQFDLLSKGRGKHCAGLGEVRFKADNVQHRPLGFFGPERKTFTLLYCAIEKGNKFVDSATCKIAQCRKAEVVNDGSRARECDWL